MIRQVTYSLFLMLIFLTWSCGEKALSQRIDKDAVPVDSFSIGPFTSDMEIQNIQPLNDSTLLTFDGSSHVFKYVENSKGIFSRNKTFVLKPLIQDVCFFWTDTSEKFSYLFYGKTVRKYNAEFELVKTYYCEHKTEFLKDNFRFTVMNSSPVIKVEHSLICNYTYENFEKNFLENFYKEKSLIRLNFDKDSVITAKEFFDKPVPLINYDIDFPSSHILRGSKIYRKSGHLDTIYVYDLKSRQSKSIAINNRDYKLPQGFNLKKLFSSDFKAQQEHYISNFTYGAMYFNENTNHFVLFYTLPAKEKGEFTRKKIRKAIVLDTNYRVINYMTLKIKYAEDFAIKIKNKGIALPIFRPDVTDEKTTYHIFNF